jgi:hypothetical protein
MYDRSHVHMNIVYKVDEINLTIHRVYRVIPKGSASVECVQYCEHRGDINPNFLVSVLGIERFRSIWVCVENALAGDC